MGELIAVGLDDHQSNVYTFSHFFDDEGYGPDSNISRVSSNSYGDWFHLALLCVASPSSLASS